MQEQKSNKTLYIILISVISVLLVIAIALFIWLQIMKKNYAKGVKEFDAQNYSQASEDFKKSPWYNSGTKLSTICQVLDQLNNSHYDKAADLANDLDSYSVKDNDMQDKIDSIRKDYYNKAGQLAQARDFTTAVSIYRSLKDYEDAAQAADYYEATDLMNNDKLEEAITLFESAGEYQDAAALADNCQNYLDAAALQEKGDDTSLEEADKLFTALGSFKDSQARGLACRSVKLFRDAKAKADAGDYEGAYKILNEYPSNPYEGWSDLLQECDNQINYKKAEKLFKDEHYYKAYLLYADLGNFKDSEKKKKKCVRDTPDKKILFQDDDFKGSIAFTFKNNNSIDQYIKMYNKNDKLAARIYVKKNSSATISLSSGTYHINEAFGTTWYGKKDMFGDVASYRKCKVNGGYNFTISNGYSYTMTSGGDLGSGDSVSGDYVNPSDF